MRIARYRQDGRERLGEVEAESVRAFPERITDLRDYLALAPAERNALPRAAPVPVSTVELLAPVRPRKNVICVGRNYLGHAEEIARARGTDVNLPAVPTFFTKPPTAIANPGAVLHLPAVSREYDWEAELAVIIGTHCRDVPEGEALSVVFGYTALNDVTARDLQRAHHQWFKGKSLDDTCPLGPWIVTCDEVPDPQRLTVRLRLNGAEKQAAGTAQMIFSVPAIIASLSAGLTLEPGDVIATGTPEGVGFARNPPEFLSDGDRVEVEIDGIGILRNSIDLP